MEFSPMLAVGIFMKFIMVVSMVVSILLILLVLIQKGKGGGLSAAFGGGGAGGLLGSKTGDVLTWVTVSLAALFLLLMIIMAKFYKPMAIESVAAPQVQTQPTGETTQTLPVTTRVEVPSESAPVAVPEQSPVEGVPATAPEQAPVSEGAVGTK